MRRGSILMLVLWIIAVLSVMVVSFAYEARLQTGVNVYVRERNRVNRLMDAGQALAEVVLTNLVIERTVDHRASKRRITPVSLT